MFFNNKTVDSVLGAFNKAIADLKEVANSNLELSFEKHSQAVALLEESKLHANEAERASNIGRKLIALIDGDNDGDVDEADVVSLSEISKESVAEEVVKH